MDLFEFFASMLTVEQIKLVVAGSLGGLVRCLVLREGWRQCLTTVFVGGVVGFYFGPLGVQVVEAVPFLGKLERADPHSMAMLGVFIVGVGGVTTAGLIVNAWRAYRRNGKDGGSA